jgi:cytoskeleton protein RodZ
MAATPPPAAGLASPATRLAPAAAPAPGAQTAAVGPAVPSGPGQVYGQQNRNPRVILRARGDTRITVKGPEGQYLINRDLKAGDSYQVPDMPGITLATSNAGAVEVDLDGIALGKAGQPQQILGHVSLDPQSLSDRYTTH